MGLEVPPHIRRQIEGRQQALGLRIAAANPVMAELVGQHPQLDPDDDQGRVALARFARLAVAAGDAVLLELGAIQVEHDDNHRPGGDRPT